MKTPATVSFVLLGGVESAVLLTHRPQLLLPASGVAMAFLVIGIRGLLTPREDKCQSERSGADAGADMLQHWISVAETRIRWSESNRTDWDRRWRPVLARRFETVAGQRPAVDRADLDAAGRLLFGAALWNWVDPGNVAPAGDRQPGPGRAVLEEILQRLEQR